MWCIMYRTNPEHEGIINAPSLYYPLMTNVFRRWLGDRQLNTIPEELRSHFFAGAYSMARMLPSWPFRAVFFEYRWRSQTCAIEVLLKSDGVPVDEKYQDVS